jgi:hypothetical protein
MKVGTSRIAPCQQKCPVTLSVDRLVAKDKSRHRADPSSAIQAIGHPDLVDSWHNISGRSPKVVADIAASVTLQPAISTSPAFLLAPLSLPSCWP